MTPAAIIRPNSEIRASGVIWVGQRLFGPEEELRMKTVRQMGNFTNGMRTNCELKPARRVDVVSHNAA
jgi:hypothetical protein